MYVPGDLEMFALEAIGRPLRIHRHNSSILALFSGIFNKLRDSSQGWPKMATLYG